MLEHTDTAPSNGGPTLTSLALRYVAQRLARGELTRETAQQYVARLLSFCDACPKVAPRDLKRRHVERWLERPDMRASYRRSRLSTLRGFTAWCVLNGHIERDPCLGVELPKLPPLLPRHLATEESTALVGAVWQDQRIRLATLLMLQECLRRGEVARIQLGDIDRAKRVLSVRGKGGQGGITRVEPISDETWDALLSYLRVVGINTGPLFRSTRYPERGVSGSWLGELVTRAMRDVGVKHFNGDGRSPHALRHTGAQDMADAGVDIRVIQAVLGHASIKNTELYIRGSVKGLREAMGTRTYAQARHPAGKAIPLDDAG